jgi:hypothetical protein
VAKTILEIQMMTAVKNLIFQSMKILKDIMEHTFFLGAATLLGKILRNLKTVFINFGKSLV